MEGCGGLRDEFELGGGQFLLHIVRRALPLQLLLADLAPLPTSDQLPIVVQHICTFCLCKHVTHLLHTHQDSILMEQSLYLVHVKRAAAISIQLQKHIVNNCLSFNLRCRLVIVLVRIVRVSLAHPLLE